MIDRRKMLEVVGVGGAVGFASSATGQFPGWESITPAALKTVNVHEFGAVGDGQTDDTAAFNRACQADAPWSEALCHAIHVPSGRYRLDGSVFVRKGQVLFGDGYSTRIDARRAKDSTFILGRRAGQGRGKSDPGGAPVSLSKLHTAGGAPARGLVATDAQGFAISDLFLTAVGVGIELWGDATGSASDGLISNIIIDQCLQGILVGKSQNIVIDAVTIYRPRFAVTISDGAHDIIVSALTVAYAQRVALTMTGRVSNIVLANSTFVSNAQYEDFVAIVVIRVPEGDALFSGCTFRNWPGNGVVQDLPGEMALDFCGCVFDGSRSSADYDWSRKPQVYAASATGRVSFQGCIFRNLRGPIVRLPAGKAQLTINGGVIEDCEGPRLSIHDGFAGVLSIRNTTGFPQAETVEGQKGVSVPLWPRAGPWRITARLPGESFAEEAIVQTINGQVMQLGGWRSPGDRRMRFFTNSTGNVSRLQAVVSLPRNEPIVFTAETAG